MDGPVTPNEVPVKNPFLALNAHAATLLERADTFLVRVDTGRRPTTGVVFAVEAERALIVTAAHALPAREGLAVARGDAEQIGRAHV